MSVSTRLSRSHRLAVALATAAAAVVVGLAAPSPAQAEEEAGHVWTAGTTVCVESHVGPEWGVRAAVRQWNRLDGGPTFVLAKSCADYDGTVTVSYRSARDSYTGWTTWFWDETGALTHADVTVNPYRIKAFASQEQSCQRRHTMTHELGHALGLRHYPHSHAGSVMSYLGWQRLCGKLAAHDQADYSQLYPVASSAAAAV